MSDESDGARGAGDPAAEPTDGDGGGGGADVPGRDVDEGDVEPDDEGDVEPDDEGDVEPDDEGDVEPDDEEVVPRLSDDGIMLAFAGAACLLAATAAHVTGQPQPVVVFATVGGVPAIGALVVDVLTDYVPDNRVHLLVGAAALAGAAFAVPGRDWVNVATLVAAAALVLWRVVDVEFRGAER